MGTLTLMAVHAHPDDEVFTGGVLAKSAREGIRTVLVTATRGEEGEIHDPDLDPDEARPRLGAIREIELARAREILGISEGYFLDYRDSGMAGTDANQDPANFHNADPDEALHRLVRIVRETRPQVIVTYDERGGYGHPDHIAAHRLAVAAFDAAGDPERFPDAGPPWQPLKLYYAAFPRSAVERMVEVFREQGIDPGWMGDDDIQDWTVPDEVVTTRVDVRGYGRQVAEALRVHRTQIPPGDPFLALPPEAAEKVWGRESYIRARSLVPVPDEEDDLFAGLR